jgi:ribonuclease P protein subunit POP4
MNSPNRHNVLRHELVGLDTKIIDDSNKNNTSIEGKIVGETKNMIIIEQNGYQKMVSKKNAVFLVKLPNEYVKIQGKWIIGRSEDRTKKRIEKKW